MSDMVERVSRAIAAKAFRTHNRRDSSLARYASPESYADERWGIYKDEARAAIEAMREPTKRMCSEPASDIYVCPHMSPDVLHLYWVHMVDEALKPCP